MNNPHTLADERMTLSAEYASLSERLGDIMSIRALEWPLIRDKTTSDAQADRIWERSQVGIEEVKVRLRLRSIDKRFSAIKTMLEVLSNEARNLY